VTTTPDERRAFIRFQLDALGERNGHHEFEHICRRVAGARIASNLLPSTGPVSGGGDQGSDFETHPTELPAELGPHGVFLALTSGAPLAFVCTIQQTKLRAKLLDDVGKALEEKPSVERVHAFITGPLSKAQRSKAIHEAGEKHGIELVVHDAAYLSEQLAEPDLYWVARRYLDAPAELAPAEPEPSGAAPAWYVADRERWRSREPLPTLGDILDLKDGLRRATFHDDARPDLPFWLELMRPLADPAQPGAIRQRARYEVAVAVLRGQRTLLPADELVRAYLPEAAREQSPERLQEASVLLMYATGAKARGQTSLSIEELVDAGDGLRAHVTELLSKDPPPNRRARLLMTLGHLNVHLNPRTIAEPAEPEALPDVRGWVTEDEEFAAPQIEQTVPAHALVDVDAAMAAWTELATSLEDARLFPIDDLASVLSPLAPVLFDHPDWRELNALVDDALANQAGQATVAARCRDRAISLRRAGRIREAIGELHRVQIDWWSGDTLRGAMLASLLLASCYQQLEMQHAALQQALTVAYVAHTADNEQVQDLLPSALALAALAEYRTGAWLGACELTEIVLMAAMALLEGGVDPEQEPFDALVVHAGMTAAAAQTMVPCALDAIRAAQARCQLDALLGGDPLDPELGAPRSCAEWDELAQGELAGPPFADLADEYTLRFAALGTSWTIRADGGDRLAERAAHRLAAGMQALLVALADEDLCLMPCTIDITVGVADTQTPDSITERTRWMPSGSGRRWRFELTPVARSIDNPEPIADELLAVLVTVLADATLLPAGPYQETITRSFQEGLGHKLFFGRPYDELRLLFEDRDLRDAVPSDCRRPLSPRWETLASAELPQRTDPGPGFSVEDARENARARCEKAGARLPRQLQLLRKTAGFARTVAELRGSGWRDHHILSSVTNITLNYRARELGIDLRDREAGEELIARPETADSPLVPPAEFTPDAMEQARRYALPAVLATWGLMLHSPTPDLDAVEAVLADRYAYWTADSPYHGDLLPKTT
jgi:hypothetical protein